MTEHELNKQHAEQLSQMILQHPTTRVIVKIDTDGINDDYAWMAGYMYAPRLEKIVLGNDDAYHTEENTDYDDCRNYYGCDADEWDDEELERRAKKIPWETVIAVNVSAT